MCDSFQVSSRQYGVASSRACRIIDRDSIDANDVFYVLSALPVIRNTTRKSVIPPGETFVHSQAIGLTTQRGFYPSVSSTSLRCPIIIKLLSKFALQHDSTYRFTTITLNYNYASNPHCDVNHEDGHARIIALGNFTGGELQLHEPEFKLIDIKNKWFDFDARKLHSTNKFDGERYSLVYFTHIVRAHERIMPIKMQLISLGIPWPVEAIENPSESIISQASISDSAESNFSLESLTYRLELECVESSELSESRYVYFMPNLNKNQQYYDFYVPELYSLIQLVYSINIQDILNNHYKNPLSINDYKNIFPIRFELLNDQYDSLSYLQNRAVTFQIWKELSHSSLLSSLVDDMVGKCPRHFDLEILSIGKVLSTRQKRKIMMLFNSKLRLSSTNSHCGVEIIGYQQKQLRLILYFQSVKADECEWDNGLLQVVLIELFTSNSPRNDENEKSSPEYYHEEMSDPSKCLTKSATPLNSTLSKLICNLAIVSSYKVVYDPFAGSCSLLLSASSLGGVCIGSDVRMINNDLQNVDCFQMNIYQAVQRNMNLFQFDCIITDPPYGRREKHVDLHGCDDKIHVSNEDRARERFQVIKPLLTLASKALVQGGRLVFLFMNYPDSDACWSEDDLCLDRYDGLRLLNICRETWKHSSGHVLARDTVIIEKVFVE